MREKDSDNERHEQEEKDQRFGSSQVGQYGPIAGRRVPGDEGVGGGERPAADAGDPPGTHLVAGVEGEVEQGAGPAAPVMCDVAKTRQCGSCGATHSQTNSPICRPCRNRASKRPCPHPGCGVKINQYAHACARHSRKAKSGVAAVCYCLECGTLLRLGDRQVCRPCQKGTLAPCLCDCGRYRKKYDTNGNIREYISGHNDSHQHKRRTVECAVCKGMFRPRHKRAILCGIACRTKWLTMNPPHGRKRIEVPCSICSATIIRAPSRLLNKNPVCSRACHGALTAKLLTGLKLSTPKRLAARRDGYECVICGFSHVIEVHHIRPKKNHGGGGDDSLDNLITLCPNHHSMADRRMISEEELREYVRISTEKFGTTKPAKKSLSA